MSAIGTKRTSPSAPHMSAFDPKRTSLSPPILWSEPIRSLSYLWGQYDAAQIHHASWWHGSVAARRARAAGDYAGDRISEWRITQGVRAKR